MRKSDQKLILVYGSHNSGKTFLYNLFAKEETYICLDIYKSHFKVNRELMLNQIGPQNLRRLKEFIFNKKIFKLKYFFAEIGRLMREFPDFNFVIKPADVQWMIDYYKDEDSWNLFVKLFTPLKIDNIIHLYAMRHPQICFATTYHYNGDTNDFIERWKELFYFLRNLPEICNIVKMEDLKKDKTMKSLLKNIPDDLRTYTQFDINDYRLNIFEKFGKFNLDLRKVKFSLKDMCDFLNYDVEDRNTELYVDDLYQLFKKLLSIFSINC